MEALVRLALGGDQHDLPVAVRLENVRTKGFLQTLAVARKEPLRCGNDGNVRPVTAALLVDVAGQCRARLRVANEHAGASLADYMHHLGQAFFRTIRAVYVVLTADGAVER